MVTSTAALTPAAPTGDAAPPGVGRLVQAADFKRLLAAPVQRRSVHFALHYLRGCPAARGKPQATGQADPEPNRDDLSTTAAPTCPKPVDDCPAQRWLGCLVPKRHARRSVTRSTLKRQIRAAVQRHLRGLSAGLWLVRLRAPFVPAQFVSADSAALRGAARLELDSLLTSVDPAAAPPGRLR